MPDCLCLACKSAPFLDFCFKCRYAEAQAENDKLKARVEAAERLIKEQDIFVALMSSAFDKDKSYSVEKFAAMSQKAIEKLEQTRAKWEALR